MKTVVLAAALLLTTLAAGADSPPPRDRLTLSATASTEVTRDLLGVTFSTTREGSDAAAVQAGLKQALDAALAEARKIAKPGQVEVQTGNFSLYPRYASKNGVSSINGWQGSAELIVEGRDTAAIAQLTGRVSTMSIARVGYTLSNELRDKVEGEVVAQAIKNFKARATDYSRQFGYGNYAIGEVNVSSAAEQGPAPRPMMMKSAMASADSQALPTEAGKATVSVTVSGAVQMTSK